MTMDGPHQDAASDRLDVRQAYRLFLGRDPEHEAVYAAWVGRSRWALLGSVLRSGEFGVRVVDSLVRHLLPSGGIFDDRPDTALRDWIVARLPLHPAARKVAAAGGWTQLYRTIFTDTAFLRAVGEGTDAGSPAFLDRLRLLDARTPSDPASPPGPRPAGARLMMTGAAGSGADILLAMLGGHPDVSIRDRSDPTRVVEGFGDGKGSIGTEPHRLVCCSLPADAFVDDSHRAIEDRSAPAICIVLRNPFEAVRQALVPETRAGRPIQWSVAHWVQAWSRTVVLAASRPDRVRIVRYEQLCADPNATIDGLQAWLGLSRQIAGDLPSEPRAPPYSSHDARVVETLLGPILDRWDETPTETLIREHHALRVPYVPGDRVPCGNEAAARILTHGFSFREDWGRWTDGPRAAITVRHGETTGLLLVELWVAHAFAVPGEPCDVVVTAGWSEPKLFSLIEAPTRLAFVASAAETTVAGVLEIEILVARPKMPDQPPADGRALGFGLEACRVTRLADRDH